MKWLLILFVFAGSLLGAEYHPSLPAIGSLDGLGVNIHFTDPQPGELEMIKAAGFKWVRMDLTWAATERERGTYDFGAYDRLVTALEKNGLRALFILDYGNKLYDEGLAPHSEEGRAAFAKWAAAAVARYTGKGFLWELWNEPNIAQFWKPKPRVQDYIALAKAVGPAIRAVAPREGVIGPATSKIDLPFFEECFKAGLLEHWCAVSVHPYRQSAPETVEEEYRSVRLLIRKYAPKDKTIPVLSGEWGYSTAWKDYDEEKQAKFLARMFLTNIANDVPLSIWYDWRDDGDDSKEAEHRFGIVRRKYREEEKEVFEPKPAYRAMQTLHRELNGMRFNKAVLPLNDPHFSSSVVPALLFKGEGGPAFVSWRQIAFGRPKELSKDFLPTLSASFKRVALNGTRTELKGDVNRRIQGAGIVASTGSLPAEDGDSPTILRPTGRDKALEVVLEWDRAPLDQEFRVGFDEAPLLIVRNPLSGEIQVQIDAKESALKQLGAGKSLAGKTVAPISRMEAEHENRAGLIVVLEKRGLLAEQPLRFQVSNFVNLRAYPRGPSFIPVHVRNPSGDPWKATLQLGVENRSVAVFEEPFQLGPGETERWLKVPFNAEHKNLRLGVRFSEYQSGCADGLTRPAGELDSSFKLQAEGDPASQSTNRWEAAQPAVGASASETPSFRLSYQFAAGWKFVRLYPSAELPLPTTPKKDRAPVKFGLWVHGDGKGCATRIRFADATGQTFQPDGPRIDWKGWRYITFPMKSNDDAPLHHWGGANDGVIHYPIKWDSIFLLDNVSREPVEGEIFLSAPTLIY